MSVVSLVSVMCWLRFVLIQLIICVVVFGVSVCWCLWNVGWVLISCVMSVVYRFFVQSGFDVFFVLSLVVIVYVMCCSCGLCICSCWWICVCDGFSLSCLMVCCMKVLLSVMCRIWQLVLLVYWLGRLVGIMLMLLCVWICDMCLLLYMQFVCIGVLICMLIW